jgi:hypothetical protein
MHVVSEDNVPPPTCLGCPDGNDEHDWKPLNAVDRIMANAMEQKRNVESEFDSPRTINSPLNVTCECGFLARDKRGLAAHLRGKQHRSA